MTNGAKSEPAAAPLLKIPLANPRSSGGNVVDGTLAGLVADRVEVGARLLRHLEQAS